jgi:sirohydrochlorin cobaltochelatase
VSTVPHSAVILFAHGARDPEWSAPFRRIAARLRAARPDLPVRLAFLELMQPAPADAVAGLVADGISHITLVPLFLAQGGHLRRIAAPAGHHPPQPPGVTIDVTQAIGDSEVLTAAIADWALAQHLSFTT